MYINGGVKSLMNKAERVDNVKSVMLINNVVFKYVSKFGSTSPFVLAWPTIDLADRCFNPILSYHGISTRKSMGDELTEHPSGLKLTELIFPSSAAINGYGEIVFGEHSSDLFSVISKTGERKVVELPATYRERKIVDQYIPGLAVDKNNNIYIVIWLEIRTVNGDKERLYMLYILDENYNVKQEHKLDFLEVKDRYNHAKIAINKNNDIVMNEEGAPEVFVCDDIGNLKHKFIKQELGLLTSLSISNKNEIMLSSKYHHVVQKYSEEGNLKSTITLPVGHSFRTMAFHRKRIHISFCATLKKANWRTQRTFARMDFLRSRPIQVVLLPF